MSPTRLVPDDQQALSLLGAAAAALLLMFAAFVVIGPVGLLLPVGLAVVLAGIRWPAFAVGLAVVPAVIIELALGDGFAPGSQFYRVGVANITVSEIVVWFAVGCVVLDCVRRRRLPPVPAPVGVALGLMAVAILVGTIVGYSAGAGLKTQFDGIRNVLPLLVSIPMVAAVMPENDRMRPVLTGAAALIALKAFLGLVQQAQFGGLGITNIVYFEPTANWLFVLYLLGLVACRLRRVSVPWWVWAFAPLVAFEFVAGLKRSLWIGLVAGLVLVVALGLSRLGRRLAIPAILAVGALVWVLVSAGFGDSLQGPVAQRVESLRPSKLAVNRADRYRLDERANVWDAIKQQPLTGLGQGVTWQAVHPLGIEYEDLRGYVHFAALWFWMKYSLLGLLAYIALMGSSLWLGLAVFRRQTDPLQAALGLGFAGAIVALVVAELTVTWIGAEPRFTLVVGAATGIACGMLPRTPSRLPAAPDG